MATDKEKMAALTAATERVRKQVAADKKADAAQAQGNSTEAINEKLKGNFT